MGVIELLIVVILLLWLLGYFGRGRWYGGRSGPVIAAPAGWLAGRSRLDLLLLIVVILVLIKLLD